MGVRSLDRSWLVRRLKSRMLVNGCVTKTKGLQFSIDPGISKKEFDLDHGVSNNIKAILVLALSTFLKVLVVSNETTKV